jgi:type IV pilus assembly protein PilE
MKKISVNGFTLIELMVTVAIVGILSAIAYPSYQNSVRQSWRSNAASCLVELAQGMERRYTANSSYVGATLPNNGCNTAEMGTRYTIGFNGTPTATAFTLQAAPTGSQTGDACGTFTVNQMGQRDVTSPATGFNSGTCWRR